MKMTIESKLKEQDFIESLLNMRYSGVEHRYLLILLCFHAMCNKWKLDKFSYYINLLDLSSKWVTKRF